MLQFWGEFLLLVTSAFAVKTFNWLDEAHLHAAGRGWGGRWWQSTPPSLPVQMLISSRNTLTEILNNIWPNIWAPVVQTIWHIKLTVTARISPVGPEDSIWSPRFYWSFSLHPSLPNIFHSFASVWLVFVLPRWLRIRRRQWHPIPVLLPGKSHGRRSLVGCSPWSRWESDTTEET